MTGEHDRSYAASTRQGARVGHGRKRTKVRTVGGGASRLACLFGGGFGRHVECDVIVCGESGRAGASIDARDNVSRGGGGWWASKSRERERSESKRDQS